MKKIINTKVFDANNENFISFYQEHGWVVLKNIFSKAEISSLNWQWREIITKYAKEVNIPFG